MNYSIPTQMPLRNVFVTEFLDAIFPDLKEMKCNKTGTGYTKACDHAARETGIDSVKHIEENSNLFRLMYEMTQSSKNIFNKTPDFISNKKYEDYCICLVSFCDEESGSIKNWLKSGYHKVNISFEAALFFTFLLLSRKECASNRKTFFEKCLEYVGITDIEDIVSRKLFDFNWHELDKKGDITRLENKAIVLFGTVTMTIFELIGRYSEEKDRAVITRLQDIFKKTFDKDSKAFEAMNRAERSLYDSNKFFSPRSINIAKNSLLQDFFVIPEFERSDKRNVMPLSEINEASKSGRLLIVAKTGMGKSAFLQMATLCMLSKRYETCENGTDNTLQEISDQLYVPKDKFIISVPARMFSFCFKDKRYMEWTNDFVTLFFNCMWEMSDVSRFYSTNSSPSVPDKEQKQFEKDDAITEELTDYLKELARAGKLLLILDSFDEISAGEMRTAYFIALHAFYRNYCCYPYKNEVGAHVIVSSREMSPETMNLLENTLDIDTNFSKYRICPLNEKQREDLIQKWNRIRNPDISDEQSRKKLRQIESNHYYSDYSANPYMLSVVCFSFDRGLKDITKNFIDTLVKRMSENNQAEDWIIMDVLTKIVTILQDVAIGTVVSCNSHFLKRTLNEHLRNYLAKFDLDRSDIDSYIERIHEIFVTEVGLIVPADGADDDYQFINNQMRFHLAAKRIKNAMENKGDVDRYRKEILPSINKIEEYVGLMIPLLCHIDTENVQLAELLVSDLAMHDFKTDSEESILIEAMIDLLLNRYGNNIATVEIPGDNVKDYVRRAQRLLLMRILTSKNFKPTDSEKKEIVNSQAFKYSQEWFSTYAKIPIQ